MLIINNNYNTNYKKLKLLKNKQQKAHILNKKVLKIEVKIKSSKKCSNLKNEMKLLVKDFKSKLN